jgi:hypothetical protein
LPPLRDTSERADRESWERLPLVVPKNAGDRNFRFSARR